MSKHTLGPWHVNGACPTSVDSCAFHGIAECGPPELADSYGPETCIANAWLISAAPELFEIAVAVARGWDESDFDLQSLSRTAKDAIAKARGQA